MSSDILVTGLLYLTIQSDEIKRLQEELKKYSNNYCIHEYELDAYNEICCKKCYYKKNTCLHTRQTYKDYDYHIHNLCTKCGECDCDNKIHKK